MSQSLGSSLLDSVHLILILRPELKSFLATTATAQAQLRLISELVRHGALVARNVQPPLDPRAKANVMRVEADREEDSVVVVVVAVAD